VLFDSARRQNASDNALGLSATFWSAALLRRFQLGAAKA
jgi:hypothetical protein